MTNSTSGIQPAIATLIQYIEVWNVDQSGQFMKLQSCCRLRGTLVNSDTPERNIRSGEGLAGMAWNQRHAIILQEAPSDLLDRIGARNGMELAALVAYPILKGQSVVSVVVFGVSSGPGAFEIWARDDRDELSINSSYYSGLQSFEFISRHVKFPKGAGLPGAVWKSGLPRLASDLPHSAGFMRSVAGDETELNTGLGLPVGTSAGNSESILLLLSSNAKPMAVGSEIWQPQSIELTDSPNLARSSTDWNVPGNRFSLKTDALVVEAWRSGLPVLGKAADLDAFECGEAVRVLLTIPVYRSTEKAAVVLLGF